MAEIRNYTMNLSDRRYAARAAAVNALRALAIAEIRRAGSLVVAVF